MNSVAANETFGIVVHGGAGVMQNLSNEKQNQIKSKIKESINAGYQILENGGSSIDAVEAAVVVLEDSSLFNAGKGSVYTSDEKQEMDASIMSGKDRSIGAVASVSNIKNPIKLARKVADQTEHVLLVGEGAKSFARSVNQEIVPDEYFFSKENLKRVRKIKQSAAVEKISMNKIGTVGAVAIDINGNLAAATSTGGMTNKMPGRVGDSPIPGSGSWAQNNVCAVSSTGHGEYFIKYQVAKEVCNRIQFLNADIETAAKEIIDELDEIGGAGGVIAIDFNGKIAMPFNTPGMIRGNKTNKTDLEIKIY